jgi:hypothetical protein
MSAKLLQVQVINNKISLIFQFTIDCTRNLTANGSLCNNGYLAMATLYYRRSFL